MTFNHNGLHFEAWEGGMRVSKDGEDVMRVIDVFRKGVPPKDEIIKFYNTLVKFFWESE